jgi:murein DD-endopeptidase MepM/ murein hydrolase activator NlpD
MTLSNPLKRFALGLALVVVSACAQPRPDVAPGATATPDPTATAAPSATPAFTPTPTASALRVADDLRARRSATPVPQRGSPCGVVDMLDFPVGSPDGDGFAARWDFGRYSSRYNGIHAGEDWGRATGDSLGQPVHAIGHGIVTYAQPLGWGVDRGVVIVRHTFADGRTILSFYGHLDPPSVVLRAGECVARGGVVGAIGKPRGRPHLHFEIRNHTPDDPGPGYWPVDPRLAGWEPPSDYIWSYRIGTSPGVQWLRPFTATVSIGVGLLSDGTLVVSDDRRLVGIDPGDGSLRWSQPVSGTIHRVALDATGAAIYVSNPGNAVQALDAQGQPMWQIDFGQPARPALMPLPGGGVVAHTQQQLIGVSAAGERLWQIDGVPPPFDWALDGDRLLFTTDAEYPVVHSVDRGGDLRWLARVGGRLAVSGEHVFVYNTDGVFRLNPERWKADLLLPLDPGALRSSRIAATSDGGAIVSHVGSADRRLIGIDAGGALRWDRSIADLDGQVARLLAIGDRVYAMLDGGDILAIDAGNGEARRILDGGSGAQLGGEAWAFATASSRVLLDFRGGMLAALDPGEVRPGAQ